MEEEKVVVKKKNNSSKANDKPKFDVNDNKIRDKFVQKVKKKFPKITVVNKKTGRKGINSTEPLIKFGKRNLMICAPSGKANWSAYQFGAKEKTIVRIIDNEDEIMDWITKRISELDKEK